ncbi:MAG TPA: hypothetical protein VFZ61_21445 [Polyangiales bacterium]
MPAEARAEDTSSPRSVVGSGTPGSCSGDAFIQAVAKGGVITFDPEPVTISLTRPAKIVNNTGPKNVIDGGGKVTPSGGGKSRILYMNTCDQQQGWTTSHCQDQDHPQLTLQNLTFVDGNSNGSAIFFVSNNHTGSIEIRSSIVSENRGGSWYPTYPQISNHDDTPIRVTDSTIR